MRHLVGFAAAIGVRTFLAEQAPGFPLSLASFSCTAMLCRYLGLNTTLIFPGCADVSASDEVQASFHRLHAQRRSSLDLLQVLHSQLLQHLARTWARLHTPATTIMDFHVSLRETYTHLHRALSISPAPWEVTQLVTNLQRESIEAWEAVDASAISVCHGFTMAFLWLVVTRLACRTCYTRLDDEPPVRQAGPQGRGGAVAWAVPWEPSGA